MDLNLTTTTSVKDNQENQLLLNAIKNKFAAKTVNEASAFSPPKFNIPLLKIPDNECTKEISDKSDKYTERSSTQLNKFLLKQLEEQHKESGLNNNRNGFVLPNLQLINKIPSKEKTNNTFISSVTTALNKLQVDEQSNSANIPAKPQTLTTPAIDLTSALASKLANHQEVKPSTRDFKKPTQNLENKEELDFKIPFIECDRIDVSGKCTILLPTSNEYCVTDISHVRLKHSLVEPSAIGRLLNGHDNKYIEPLPLTCFLAEFQKRSFKHTIEPFRFDTKSPDDLVTDALNKYQRRYHN